MRGRYKRKDPKEVRDETAHIGAGLSPPGETAAGLAEPHTPVPSLTVQDVGGRKKGKGNLLLGQLFRSGGSFSVCFGSSQISFQQT